MADASTFGGRVKQARREMSAREGRDVSQGEVAAALGVTYTTVSRWENDLKEPDLATIARLADVLGVTPCFLAFGAEGGGVATRPDGPVELRPPLKFQPPPKRRPKRA